MAELETGFFGKLPSNGDFVRRRVPAQFGDKWDVWLQACIHQSRQLLGDAWLDTYLTSPVWRYCLSYDVIDDFLYTGILLPSVDNVGRYFPFSVFVKIPNGSLAMNFISIQQAWFERIENILLNALEAENFSLDELDNEICKVLLELQSENNTVVNVKSTFDIISFERGLAIEQSLQSFWLFNCQTKSLWWTEGSENIYPCMLSQADLPSPELFTCMLDGNWQQRNFTQYWLPGEEIPDNVSEPTISSIVTQNAICEDPTNLQLKFNSRGISHPGSTRDYNEDRFLEEPHRNLWVVADGMGGHSKGDVASEWTTESLSATALSSDWITSRDLISKALGVTNRRLRDLGGDDIVGSTVAILYCMRGQALCMWAGDSRIYRVSNQGNLERLTADHSLVAAGNQFAPSNVITRAVGVDDELSLDTVLVEINKGERFLLCSDGLYSALGEESLTHILMTELSAENAAEQLIEQSLSRGADDNVTALVVDVVS